MLVIAVIRLAATAATALAQASSTPSVGRIPPSYTGSSFLTNLDEDYRCGKECKPWFDYLRENGKYNGAPTGWTPPNGSYQIARDKECAAANKRLDCVTCQNLRWTPNVPDKYQDTLKNVRVQVVDECKKRGNTVPESVEKSTRNASDVSPPMVGGTLATPTWAPPDEPCDPKKVTWFSQATFTYAHKCSEACDEWYGLLYKNGTYTGPLTAGQKEPDGKYVIEPKLSCPHVDWLVKCMTCTLVNTTTPAPNSSVEHGARNAVTACRQGGYTIPASMDKYRNVNPHVDPLGSGPINDLCHTRIVGCFGDVDCRNLTDPTGTYFYNSSTGAYNNRSPGGDSIDINSVNGVPLSVGQGRTSGTSQPTSSSSSIGSSEMPSATVPSTSSDTASTTEGQQLASSGASAAPAAESKNADSSGAAMTTPLVSVLGLAVVALFW